MNCGNSSYLLNPSSTSSLQACLADRNTYYQHPTNPNIVSYDLMISTAPGCYPMVGTIDFSVYSNSESCPNPDIVSNRVQVGFWLYNGSSVLGPLKGLLGVGGSTSDRSTFATNICHSQCGGNSSLLGFDYCAYRYCTYHSGDYEQVASACDPATQLRTVTYVLSSTSSCISSPQYTPTQDIKIVCDHVVLNSSLGTAAYCICILGMCISFFILAIAIKNRSDRAIRRSQPVFIFIFIFGCIMLNSSIFLFIGENTDVTCLGRPWLVNLAITIMIGPVLLKLHRIDKLFNTHGIKKVKVSDTKVYFQLLMIICVDIVILLAWTYSDSRPMMKFQADTYPNLRAPVIDQICTTDSVSIYEWMIVLWKLLVLGGGIYKSVRTRNVSAEYSEAKHFAAALYVIGIVGACAYALRYFILFAPEQLIFIRCLGIFVCSTVAIIFVMGPKLSKGIEKLMGSGDVTVQSLKVGNIEEEK
jgi:hypothetical protein